jgi:hypothetical protein
MDRILDNLYLGDLNGATNLYKLKQNVYLIHLIY